MPGSVDDNTLLIRSLHAVSMDTVQWCRLVLRALVRHHFKHAWLLCDGRLPSPACTQRAYFLTLLCSRKLSRPGLASQL